MPIKSKAQRRKFAQLLIKGEITPETFEEWNRAAGDKELPERLHPKRKAKSKRKKVGTRRKLKAKLKRTAKARTTRAKKRSRPAKKRR